MKRVDLLAKLECAEAALARADLIPILTHFCFTGKSVIGYNDRIGISAPLKTDFEGAVPGKVLLDLLKASRAENVELNPKGNDAIVIKAASSRITLPLLPVQDFPFKMPKPTEGVKVPLPDPELLFHAIETCLRSVSNDTSIPDQLGITVIPKQGFLDLFATNNATLSHARLKGKSDAQRCVLPAGFCEQALALSKSSPDTTPQLIIAKGHALWSSGDIDLFGRLIDVDQPLDFNRMLDRMIPSNFENKMVTIPTKLKLIVDRAVIMTESEKVQTQISVKAGVARFISKSSFGEVADMVQLPDHPDVTMSVDAKLLKTGYRFFETMLMTERCTIMMRDNELYLVACRI